jgi:transcriptional regulator with XRE-family HTH domain
MKLSDLSTREEVLAERLDADPEYRREWEHIALALARAVAVKVIAYRAEHGLSQTALAGCLKMTQPAVARLESGEYNPTFPTLLRLSDALGVELAINISPTGQEPQLIGKRASAVLWSPSRATAAQSSLPLPEALSEAMLHPLRWAGRHRVL